MENSEGATKLSAKEIQILKEVRYKSILESVTLCSFAMLGLNHLMQRGIISAKNRFIKLGGIGMMSYMAAQFSSRNELKRRLTEEVPDGYFIREERFFRTLSPAEKKEYMKNKWNQLTYEQDSQTHLKLHSQEDTDIVSQNAAKLKPHLRQLYASESVLQTTETSEEPATNTPIMNTDNFAHPPSIDVLNSRDQRTLNNLETRLQQGSSNINQPLHRDEQASTVKRRIRYGDDTTVRGLSPGLAGQQAEETTSKYSNVKRNQYGDEIVE